MAAGLSGTFSVCASSGTADSSFAKSAVSAPPVPVLSTATAAMSAVWVPGPESGLVVWLPELAPTAPGFGT